MATPEKVIDPLDFAERQVEQLRREVRLDRMKTSQAIEGLMKYVEEHEKSDYLVTGFNDPAKNKNPYKRKRLKKCIIL